MKITDWIASLEFDWKTVLVIVSVVLSAAGSVWAIRDTITAQTTEIATLRVQVEALKTKTDAQERNILELTVTLKVKGVIQ
jgi:hypothetical protein